jgi:hypothetical protein
MARFVADSTGQLLLTTAMFRPCSRAGCRVHARNLSGCAGDRVCWAVTRRSAGGRGEPHGLFKLEERA